jgi:DNA-binding XRE family transcriptional regulator
MPKPMRDEREVKTSNNDSGGELNKKPANDPDKLERLIAAGRTTEPMNWGELHDGMVIAYQLKQAREQMGLTLAEVEEISGMGRGQLSKLENGRSNPTLATLTRYATAIGKRFKMILADAEPEEDSSAAQTVLTH